MTTHARPPAPPGPPAAAPEARTPSPATTLRILDSQSLLQGQQTVLIEHRGELYRLQATRLGKLILTK